MNIYEIFESMREYQLEHKYNLLEESIRNLDFILEDDVLTEAVEAEQSRIKRVVAFIREMWKKFVDWIRSLTKRVEQKERDLEELLEHDFTRIAAILVRYKSPVKVDCYDHASINSVMISLNRCYMRAKSFSGEYKYADGNDIYTNDVLLSAVSGAKSIEDIPRIIRELAHLTDKDKVTLSLADCYIKLDPVANLNHMHEFREKLEQFEKDSKDFYEKEIKAIESNPKSLESQLKYFKFGNRVITEVIRVHAEVANKIASIDESIVRKMVSEVYRIMDTKEYKKDNKKNRGMM